MNLIEFLTINIINVMECFADYSHPTCFTLTPPHPTPPDYAHPTPPLSTNGNGTSSNLSLLRASQLFALLHHRCDNIINN